MYALVVRALAVSKEDAGSSPANSCNFYVLIVYFHFETIFVNVAKIQVLQIVLASGLQGSSK